MVIGLVMFSTLLVKLPVNCIVNPVGTSGRSVPFA